MPNMTGKMKQIKYPYITKKRTILVGGHNTFVNVMKKRFPNIKFVDERKVSVDPRIIRYADVVWLQNNCMCHPQFKNVIRTANLYRVPIKYFAAAGTSRASKQIINNDIELKNN